MPLAAGDAGTAQTVGLIRLAVDRAVANPEVRETAARILQSIPAYDDLAEARAVYEWVLENIRYTRDPVNREMVSDAAWTLRHRIGDCDDINAVLLPALLMTIGFPVRIVTIANDSMDPDSFAHVYAEVQVHGEWIPLDAAREGARFAIPPARAYRKRIWSLTENSYQDAPGVGLAGQMIGQEVEADHWYSNLSDWINAAGNVITPIFQPMPTYGPPAPGSTYPTGTTYPAPAPAGSGIDTGTLLLIGAVGLGAVLLLKK